jgi:hypothetical protein
MEFAKFELDNYKYNTDSENMYGGFPIKNTMDSSKEFTVIGGGTQYKSRLDNMIIPAGLVKNTKPTQKRNIKTIDAGFLNETDFNELFGLALHGTPKSANRNTKRKIVVGKSKVTKKRK